MNPPAHRLAPGWPRRDRSPAALEHIPAARPLPCGRWCGSRPAQRAGSHRWPARSSATRAPRPPPLRGRTSRPAPASRHVQQQRVRRRNGCSSLPAPKPPRAVRPRWATLAASRRACHTSAAVPTTAAGHQAAPAGPRPAPGAAPPGRSLVVWLRPRQAHPVAIGRTGRPDAGRSPLAPPPTLSATSECRSRAGPDPPPAQRRTTPPVVPGCLSPGRCGPAIAWPMRCRHGSSPSTPAVAGGGLARTTRRRRWTAPAPGPRRRRRARHNAAPRSPPAPPGCLEAARRGRPVRAALRLGSTWTAPSSGPSWGRPPVNRVPTRARRRPSATPRQPPASAAGHRQKPPAPPEPRSTTRYPAAPAQPTAPPIPTWRGRPNGRPRRCEPADRVGPGQRPRRCQPVPGRNMRGRIMPDRQGAAPCPDHRREPMPRPAEVPTTRGLHRRRRPERRTVQPAPQHPIRTVRTWRRHRPPRRPLRGRSREHPRRPAGGPDRAPAGHVRGAQRAPGAELPASRPARNRPLSRGAPAGSFGRRRAAGRPPAPSTTGPPRPRDPTPAPRRGFRSPAPRRVPPRAVTPGAGDPAGPGRGGRDRRRRAADLGGRRRACRRSVASPPPSRPASERHRSARRAGRSPARAMPRRAAPHTASGFRGGPAGPITPADGGRPPRLRVRRAPASSARAGRRR